MKRIAERYPTFPVPGDEPKTRRGPPTLEHDLSTWDGYNKLQKELKRPSLVLNLVVVKAANLKLRGGTGPSHLFEGALSGLAAAGWLTSLELSMEDWSEVKWRALVRLVQDGFLKTLMLSVLRVDVPAQRQMLETVESACRARRIDVTVLEKDLDMGGGEPIPVAPAETRLVGVSKALKSYIQGVNLSGQKALDLRLMSFEEACHVLSACPHVREVELRVGTGAAPGASAGAFKGLTGLWLNVDTTLDAEHHALQAMLAEAGQLKILSVRMDSVISDPRCIEHLGRAVGAVTTLEQIRLVGLIQMLDPYTVDKFRHVLLRNPGLKRFTCRIFAVPDSLSLLAELADPRRLPLLKELVLGVNVIDPCMNEAVRHMLYGLVQDRPALTSLTLWQPPLDGVDGDACDRFTEAVERSTTLRRLRIQPNTSLKVSWGRQRARRVESRLLRNNPDLLDNLATGLKSGAMSGLPLELRRLVGSYIGAACDGHEILHTAGALRQLCHGSYRAMSEERADKVWDVLELLIEPSREDLHRAARKAESLEAARIWNRGSRSLLSAYVRALRDGSRFSIRKMAQKLDKWDALAEKITG